MSADRCPDCGAAVAGGRDGCQALLDEITVRAYSEPGYAATHDRAFDAYCMQHPKRYCRTAKSYAAHLTRLCCWIEHRGDRRILQAIQKWLNGLVAIEKPEPVSSRGDMNVTDLGRAASVDEHTKLVHDWANCVWEAYANQHDLARTWIKAAVDANDT